MLLMHGANVKIVLSNTHGHKENAVTRPCVLTVFQMVQVFDLPHPIQKWYNGLHVILGFYVFSCIHD
jgi:hypothetical protein